MKLIERLGYYGLGLFFGIVILIFFLGGKKTSCDYSPNARVLKNIRIKEKIYSEESLAFFSKYRIDTAVVSNILNNGNVDFSESITNTEPCKTYRISGNHGHEENLLLTIKNCDSTATILHAKKVSED